MYCKSVEKEGLCLLCDRQVNLSTKFPRQFSQYKKVVGARHSQLPLFLDTRKRKNLSFTAINKAHFTTSRKRTNYARPN